MSEAVDALMTSYERLLANRIRSHAPVVGLRFESEGLAAIQRALATSPFPDGLAGENIVSYDSGALRVEYELPRQDVIPRVSAYEFVRRGKQIRPVLREEAEGNKLYADLIARVTLRVLAEIFDLTPPSLVARIDFHGFVSAKDRATGRPIRPLLVSVRAERELFAGLVLDELDPATCLRKALKATVSQHPADLESVVPFTEIDLSKYKLVDEMDVVEALESRPDLLALKPTEFEHLVRQLFAKIGMTCWVTQASSDDGVDALAVNEDPIVGGTCVIQAKRYSGVVGVESVRALAGTIDDKGVTKGLLVTTSWVSPAGWAAASKNGRIEILEGRQLKALLREHLGIDALISLPKSPQHWLPQLAAARFTPGLEVRRLEEPPEQRTDPRR